jgi:hypothetical protein
MKTPTNTKGAGKKKKTKIVSDFWIIFREREKKKKTNGVGTRKEHISHHSE